MFVFNAESHKLQNSKKQKSELALLL